MTRRIIPPTFPFAGQMSLQAGHLRIAPPQTTKMPSVQSSGWGEDLDALVERIHLNSNGQSRQATGAAASNLDLYQVKCIFYDVLGHNHHDYLLAHAIQFFAPGVSKV